MTTQTATSIRTVPVTETLYVPCQLALDIRTGHVTIEPSPAIGLVQTWSLPPLSAEAANALLWDLGPLMQRILESATITRDPYTHTESGRITDEDALDELAHNLDGVDSDLDWLWEVIEGLREYLAAAE